MAMALLVVDLPIILLDASLSMDASGAVDPMTDGQLFVSYEGEYRKS